MGRRFKNSFIVIDLISFLIFCFLKKHFFDIGLEDPLIRQYFSQNFSAGQNPLNLCDFVRNDANGFFVLSYVLQDLRNALVALDILKLLGIQCIVMDDFKINGMDVLACQLPKIHAINLFHQFILIFIISQFSEPEH